MEQERSSRAIIDEQYFYGKQSNKFPKRQDQVAIKEKLQKEIVRQKQETLSISEYSKLKQDCIDKNVRFIPIFICDSKNIRGIRNIKRFQLLYLFLSAHFTVFTFFTNVPLKLGSFNFFYTITALSNLVNVGIFYKSR